MFFDVLRNLIIISVIISPFIVQLSIYSLKYYVATYKISSESVEIYLNELPKLLRVFYSRYLKDMYFNNLEYTREQIAASLSSQRILAAIIPILILVATVIGFIRLIYSGDIYSIQYALILLIIILALWFAWRFGIRLVHRA
jgi:hypothetical protein